VLFAAVQAEGSIIIELEEFIAELDEPITELEEPIMELEDAITELELGELITGPEELIASSFLSLLLESASL
jgi:hypothetical protein